MFRAGLIIGDAGTQLIMEVGGAQVNNRGCRGLVNCQYWGSSANYLSQPLLFLRQQGGQGWALRRGSISGFISRRAGKMGLLLLLGNFPGRSCLLL